FAATTLTFRRLEPVLLLEDEVKDQASHDHGDDGDVESRFRVEAGVGHIHAEVPGDQGGDGDDRGPAGDLLGDDVEPVALDGDVGLQDAGHHVAQAVGPLGGAQHVIVDVLVVGHQVFPNDVQVTPHHRVHHLAHGDHHPAQQHQAPAQLEAAPLDLQVVLDVLEQSVLDVLHAVVQALHRVEVGVHDVVEQPVQQVADPELD